MSPTSTERLGDPSGFAFRGQCYDAGSQSKAKCTLCGRPIRLVFILKSPQDRSVPSGSCCFHKTSPEVRKKLDASLIWLKTTMEAEAHAVKTYRPRAERDARMAAWRKLKAEALRKIRDYRRESGKEWLPEELFNLQLIVAKKPAVTATARWFENRIKELSSKI